MANDSCVFENYKSGQIFRIYYNTSIAKAQTILLYVHFVEAFVSIVRSSTMTLLCHIIQSEYIPSSNAFASLSLSIQLNNDTALTPRSCSFFT